MLEKLQLIFCTGKETSTIAYLPQESREVIGYLIEYPESDLHEAINATVNQSGSRTLDMEMAFPEVYTNVHKFLKRCCSCHKSWLRIPLNYPGEVICDECKEPKYCDSCGAEVDNDGQCIFKKEKE